jgi:hypothetical protein
MKSNRGGMAGDVAFPVERPELFRLMFCTDVLCQTLRQPTTHTDPTAVRILDAVLDDLCAQDHISAPPLEGTLVRQVGSPPLRHVGV